jgi:hypothetical protein
MLVDAVKTLIQGSNIRISVFFVDTLERGVNLDQIYPKICKHLERLFLRWANVQPMHIVFSDLFLASNSIQGLVKVDKNIQKLISNHSSGLFLLEMEELGEVYRIEIRVQRTEFPRSKTPFETFMRYFKPKHNVYWFKDHSINEFDDDDLEEQGQWKSTILKAENPMENLFSKQFANESALKEELISIFGVEEILK